MLTTALVVLLQLAILTVLGVAALSPLSPERRAALLPVAPVFGAALIAVVTNWTCRWLSVPQSLPIVALAATALAVHGLARVGRWPLRSLGTGVGRLGLGLLVSCGGLVVAAAATAGVGGLSAVAPAYTVDHYYFGGVSTYLVDEPLLPGPAVTDAWVGDDPPATSPAADTVRNHLRFGQSAVAASLSVLVGQPPYATVNAASLLWLLLLGLSVAGFLLLLGLRSRWALLGPACATSSFYVVSQALEGKNDGLLGASFFLLATALTVAVLGSVGRAGHSWALVLVGAALAATYSEYFLLLVPTLLVLVVLGPLQGLVHRMNLVAAHWAAAAVLAPWALVWLARSFKTTTRFTDGPTPFSGREGTDLFRTYLGVVTFEDASTVNVLLLLAAVVSLAGLVAGWAWFVRYHEARGALVGLVLVVGVLEARAWMQHSGNLQYRVLQLALPALVAFAVLGWRHLTPAPVPAPAPAPAQGPSRGTRVWPVVLACVAALTFVVSNLATVVVTTSLDRARAQNVPPDFAAEVTSLVREVGGREVTVVAPRLTDVSSLSLLLANDRDVSYPTVTPSTYLGPGPLWDREADDYYVVGPGASAFGDVDVLARHEDYRVVRLGRTGVIVSPFHAPDIWPRLTFMRGLACATPGLTLLVLRGSGAPGTFDLAVTARAGLRAEVRLLQETGELLRRTAPTQMVGGWTRTAYRLPSSRVSLVTIHPLASLVRTRSAGYPLRFGPQETAPEALRAVEPALVGSCLAGSNEGMDAYDRELTFMRAAP